MAAATKLDTAARDAAAAIDEARAEVVAAQTAADTATEVHDSLMERAYNGDDSIPWAQVKRCERDMVATAARLDQARAALADAERAATDAEREATLARFTAALTDGKLGKAWGKYVGYVSSAYARADELNRVPHGRKHGQSNDEWHAQRSLDHSEGAISPKAAAELIEHVRHSRDVAHAARREFEEAARKYNALLDEAIEALRGYGLADCLIDGGRGGFTYDGETVRRCDLDGGDVARYGESLRVLSRRLEDAVLRLSPPAAREEPPPVDPFLARRRAEIEAAKAAKADAAADAFPTVTRA